MYKTYAGIAQYNWSVWSLKTWFNTYSIDGELRVYNSNQAIK